MSTTHVAFDERSSERYVQIIPTKKTDANKRLDKFLSEEFPEKSRAYIQRLIQGQKIFVGGKAVKASYRIRGDERIQLTQLEPIANSLSPENIPLEVVYEDEDLVVINKSADMVVHRGAGVTSGTLVNALLYHFSELSKVGGTDRLGIVHRLDKRTSGLIVVAKNDFSHFALSRQFQLRQVTKEYIALVHGVLNLSQGEITAPIGRDRVHRIRMTTRAVRSRDAQTCFQVIERLPELTLLRLNIKTGRTHQIRVHLSSIKHPIVGDMLYGAPGRIILPGTEQPVPTLTRHFLHAALIEFSHPRTHHRLRLQSDLPYELRGFLEQLRRSSCCVAAPLISRP